MLEVGKHKRVLLLCCSAAALAGALGASVSTAWAAQDTNVAVSAVPVGDGMATVSGDTNVIAQAKLLARLQRKQIVLQRQELGLDSNGGALPLDFGPLPSDPDALNEVIEAQQNTIKALNRRLQEAPVATAEAAAQSGSSEPNADVVGRSIEAPGLPRQLPEQDRMAREAFDRALTDNRTRTVTVRAEPQQSDGRPVEPSLSSDHPAFVVANFTPEAAPVPDAATKLAEPMPAKAAFTADSRNAASGPEIVMAAATDQALAVPPSDGPGKLADDGGEVPEVVNVASQTAEATELEELREALRQQSELLERQARQLEEQQRAVEAQRARLEELERQVAAQPAASQQPIAVLPEPTPRMRSAAFVMPKALVVPGAGTYSLAADDDNTTPDVVGEEQGEQQEQRRREIAGVEEAGGVLTRSGSFIIEPSIQYSQSNINRFFFQGLEIVDTVLIGNIEATDSDRDSITAKIGARYGFTSRIEGSVSIPWNYRDDRVTRQIVSANTSTTTVVDGSGLGDIEVSGRYQINSGRQGWPIFVANGRFKSDTGKGPFEVSRDINGIETELATGSGFFGIEPGLTTLIRSDPVVFFVNGRYLFHLGRDVDTTVGTTFIGHVDPGDVASFAAGMGFGINEEASFSLGYDHSFVMATTTELNGIETKSTDIDVGSLSLGFSYRISPLTSLNFNVKAGVTEDAPDVQMILRMPFRF